MRSVRAPVTVLLPNMTNTMTPKSLQGEQDFGVPQGLETCYWVGRDAGVVGNGVAMNRDDSVAATPIC